MLPTAKQNEFLCQPERFNGYNIELHGMLTVGNDSAYLTIESVPGDLTVEIREDNFADKLIPRIPCYVGGKYLYLDEADVIGRVAVSETGKIALDQIQLVRVKRDDEMYEYLKASR